MKYSQENLSSELTKLMAEKTESQQFIKDLEEDIKVLNDRDKEGNMELERRVFETQHLSLYSFSLSLKMNLFFVFQAEGETEENVQSNET